MSTPNSASPNVAGSAAFLPNDRDAHDRAPEMELFRYKLDWLLHFLLKKKHVQKSNFYFETAQIKFGCLGYIDP